MDKLFRTLAFDVEEGVEVRGKRKRQMTALKHTLDRLPPRDYANFLHGVEVCPISCMFKIYCTCKLCNS